MYDGPPLDLGLRLGDDARVDRCCACACAVPPRLSLVSVQEISYRRVDIADGVCGGIDG